jgi:hypothetical protein
MIVVLTAAAVVMHVTYSKTIAMHKTYSKTTSYQGGAHNIGAQQTRRGPFVTEAKSVIRCAVQRAVIRGEARALLNCFACQAPLASPLGCPH